MEMEVPYAVASGHWQSSGGWGGCGGTGDPCGADCVDEAGTEHVVITKIRVDARRHHLGVEGRSRRAPGHWRCLFGQDHRGPSLQGEVRPCEQEDSALGD